MTDLPVIPFANPVWHALQTKHCHLAITEGEASRYPADVAPFAAVASPGTRAMHQLRSLLEPGESVYLIGDHYHPIPHLSTSEPMQCLQMVLPLEVVPPAPTAEIVPLSSQDAPEMVALTTLAFPGFFRQRTCEMGPYFGIRSNSSDLIAMAGERLLLEGHPEISGVCTHPAHRGQGLASALIWHLVRNHRRDALMSWLHVAAANQRAVDLYLGMGFNTVRQVTLHLITREN